MTEGYINGSIISILIGNVEIDEQIDAAFNLKRSLLKFLNKGSGGAAKYEYGELEWDASGKAHLKLDAVTGYDTLADAILNKTKLTVRFTTDVTGDMEFTGEMLIESLGQASATEEGVEFDYSFKGSGIPVKAVVPV